jgi:hypothetical protein
MLLLVAVGELLLILDLLAAVLMVAAIMDENGEVLTDLM